MKMSESRDAKTTVGNRARVALYAVLMFGAGSAAAPAFGFTITPTFASNITSDPNAATIESTINTAIGIYEADFTDPINVNITFQEMNAGLGSSSTAFFNVSYAAYRAALIADATTADDATAIAHLGAGPNDPVLNQTSINVKSANLRAVGLAASVASDGTIGLNTSITTPGSPGSSLTYSLQAVAEHEIDEVLGLGSSLSDVPFGDIFPEDLFRYAANGTRSFTSSSSAQSFFSINGTTDLAQFDNQNDGGDFGDWQSNPLPNGVNPQVQDAFATPGSSPALGVELRALDVIGYNHAVTVPEPVSISCLGVLSLGLLARRRRA
jgi:hypothetical protein